MMITISTDGEVRFLWNDSLHEFAKEGDISIRRASHVEPNENGQWEADLSLCNGPTLGPYDLRQDALDAEVAWLEANHL